MRGRGRGRWAGRSRCPPPPPKPGPGRGAGGAPGWGRGWGRGSSSGDPHLPAWEPRLCRRAPLPRCSPRSRPGSCRFSRAQWAGRGGRQSGPCARSLDTRRAKAGSSERLSGPVSIRALGLVFPPAAPSPRPASAPRVPPRGAQVSPAVCPLGADPPPDTRLLSGRSRAPMRPARPGAPVPALLLLALVLAPRGTQGRPGGLRGAHVAGEEPKPSLPAASRSAGEHPRAPGLGRRGVGGASDGSEPRWAGAA